MQQLLLYRECGNLSRNDNLTDDAHHRAIGQSKAHHAFGRGKTVCCQALLITFSPTHISVSDLRPTFVVAIHAGKQFRALLISTVRTRHNLRRSLAKPAPPVGSANQQDEELYYGFLSDHKLLTMALTRAQSLVIVVGEPVTLCLEGQCSTMWKSYLEECEKNNSLRVSPHIFSFECLFCRRGSQNRHSEGR